MNRKYTPEQEAEFHKLRAEGMSLRAAAAKVGVPIASAAKWNASARRKEAPPSPISNVTEGTVPAPAPGTGGAREGSGAGGAEAALRALVDGEEVPLETVDEDGNSAPPPPEEETIPPIDPVRVLMDVAKLSTFLQVRFYAFRYKVEMTEDLQKALKWTAEDEAGLEEYAPGTARLLGTWLTDYGQWVSPLFFLGTLMMINGDRIAKVKARGTPPDGKSKPKQQPKPSDRKDGKQEVETEEDPLPNGYAPVRAVATDDMDELMRGSFYSRQ